MVAGRAPAGTFTVNATVREDWPGRVSAATLGVTHLPALSTGSCRLAYTEPEV